MNIRIRCLHIAFILVMVSFSSTLSARILHPMTVDLGPYVGLDLQMRSLGFPQNYGNNLFSKDYPQGNIFVGLMVSEYLGVELGYEKTLIKSRTRIFVCQKN